MHRPQAPATSSRSSQATDAATPVVTVASGRRVFVAHLVDGLLFVLLFALVAGTEIAVFGEARGPVAQGLLDRVALGIHHYFAYLIHGAVSAVALGLTYSFIATRRSGQTLGRRLTNTVLVRVSGQPLVFPILAIRSAASVLSLLAFGAGYFWATVERNHRTFHDLMAGTVLVDRKARSGIDAS